MARKIKTNLEHKTFAVHLDNVTEVKADDGTKERVLEGYASIFGNVDSYGDIVLPGAFKKTLDEKNRGRKVKFLYQHNSYEPIGVPIEISEDAKGLKFKAVFADTQRADEAYKLAKLGALDGLSIGYRTIKAEDNENGTRNLAEIDLAEVSLVTFEANTQAKVTDVKSAKGEALIIAGLMQLGHSQDEAVRAVKELSLEDDEPADNGHSEKRADTATDPKKETAASDDSRKDLDDVLHSLRALTKQLKSQ